MCNPGGCCSDPDSRSDFCDEQMLLLGDLMEEACYYCCREPQEYKASSIRRTLNEANPSEGSRAGEAVGEEVVVEKKDYNAKIEDFQRRSLQKIHAIDYENIDWYAYEWMVKVGTEYYFRYEGTMLVPPCWETVHWRVMKDPIRVHKRQIDELHRLLAWRLNPDTCTVDTAGIVSEDGNRVAVNREIQYNTDIHRLVFCECTDWISNFEADQLWCAGSDEPGNYTRLYDRPYSFDTGSEWIPS
jgi:Eukaryotic-type carbonic anhydrase